MNISDFKANRAKAAQPVEQRAASRGGLIPTSCVPCDIFAEVPLVPPAALRQDCCGESEDARRVLFRGRVLDTFGKPVKKAFVVVMQDDGAACCETSSNGVFEVLVACPERVQLEQPVPAPAACCSCLNVRVSKGDAVLCCTRLYFDGAVDNAADVGFNGTRLLSEFGEHCCSFDIVVEVPEGA